MTGSTGGRPDPYRELFERSTDPIFIIEGDAFVDCNEAAVRILKYASREDVLQLHPWDISPPRQPDGRDSFEKANELLERAFSRGSLRFEWLHLAADGGTFPVEVLLTAVSEEGRRVLHVVWRSLAERKLLEESLRHAQKMDAVGKLAGGIAHDFNNFLVVILGNTELLESHVEDDPLALEYLRQVRGSAERAAGLVRQLLAFGRKQQLLPEVMDVRDLLEDLRPLIDRLVGARHDLRIENAVEPLPVEADRGQVEQVLMNLASNSRDAMPVGGTLTVSTSRSELAPGDAVLASGLDPGSYALVTVSDSGVGMPRDVVERAFDPFFSTKGDRGTGLGLATSYGIAKQSGGTIEIDSAVGMGTVVSVYLPITGKSARPTRDRPMAIEGGDERILVVEDEDDVRRLIVSALEAQGYDLEETADGVSGQKAYEQDPGAVDLIVADVILPGLTGPQMIEAIEALGHRPRVLYISGYTDDSLPRRHKFGHDVALLPKPFSTSTLARAVREALDREHGPG